MLSRTLPTASAWPMTMERAAHQVVPPWDVRPHRQALEAEGTKLMIFIVVKFTIRVERSSEWLSLIDDFTQATRQEPGNIFFEWSRNVDDPHQFILVEAFESSQAGEAHVNSEHFRTAMAWVPDAIVKTPEIVNAEVPQDGWSKMAELAPR